jgi:hypothetical protein
MRRIAWIAVGAVGGIIVYRRGRQFVSDARQQGMAATAQQAGASAWASAQTTASLVLRARSLLTKAVIAQAAASQALAQHGQQAGVAQPTWPSGPVSGSTRAGGQP